METSFFEPSFGPARIFRRKIAGLKAFRPRVADAMAPARLKDERRVEIARTVVT